MKPWKADSRMLTLAACAALALCLWSGFQATAEARGADVDSTRELIQEVFEAPPTDLIQQAPGELIFEGIYRHTRGNGILSKPERRWIKRKENDTLIVVSDLPFMDVQEYVEGGQLEGFKRYELRFTGADPSSLSMEFEVGKVLVSRQGRGENWQNREFEVPARALFTPSNTLDSFGAYQILTDILKVPLRSPEESEVYDWAGGMQDFAFYRSRLRNAGLEEVVVPGGRFRAYHLVLEQTTAADTAFQKQAGDITDIWMLRDGIIIRVLRYSDEYEVSLLDWKAPQDLYGLIEKRTPVFLERAAPLPPPAPERVELTSGQRIEGCWTDQGFKMPYHAAVYLTPYRAEAGGVTEFGVGTGVQDFQVVFRQMPKNPQPPREQFIGTYDKGQVIPFCLKTTWREIAYWVATTDDSYAARVTFHDADGSLGEQPVLDQIGPDRWLMNLDDANSYKYDDDDNDILVQIRLERQ